MKSFYSREKSVYMKMVKNAVSFLTGVSLISSNLAPLAAPLHDALAPKTSLSSQEFKDVYRSREKDQEAVRECAHTLCGKFQAVKGIALSPAVIEQNMQRLIDYGVYTSDRLLSDAALLAGQYLSFNDTGTYRDDQKKEIWRVFNFMILIGMSERDIGKIFPRAAETEGLGLIDSSIGALHRVMKKSLEDGGYSWITDQKGGPYFSDPAYIDFMGLQDGDTYVDLMGGAGGEAIGIAKKYPRARVVMVDLNSRNIFEAVRRASEAKLDNIRFVLGNVLASRGGTGIPSGSVRAVTVTGYALFNYPPQKLSDIFDEILRILTPDGRIFFDFAESSSARESDVLAAMDDAARKHGATVIPEEGLNGRKRPQFGYTWYGFRLGDEAAQRKVAIQKKINRYAQTLVNFLAVRDELPQEPADVLLVLGNSRVETAERAAVLYLMGKAKRIVVSGGIGPETPRLRDNARRSKYQIQDIDEKAEAEIMAGIMTAKGVPAAVIEIQKASTDTGEIVRNTLRLLQSKDDPFGSIIVMTHPLMQRRAMAAMDRWFGLPVRSYAYAPFIPDIAAMGEDERKAAIEMALGEVESFGKYGPAGTGDIAEVKMSYVVRDAYLRSLAARTTGVTDPLTSEINGVPIPEKGVPYDRDKARAWIAAGETPESRSIRQKIADNITHVSFADFRKNLDRAAARDALLKRPVPIDARLAGEIETHLASIRENGLRPYAESGIPSDLGFKDSLSGNVVNPTLQIMRRTPQVIDYKVVETGKGGSLSLADLGKDNAVLSSDSDELAARKVATHLLLYANNDALLPVAAERAWDYGTGRLTDVLADRIRNTVLFVTVLDKARLPAGSDRSDIDADGGPLEYHAAPVGAQDIEYILVPAHLYETVRRVFANQGQKIICVGYRTSVIAPHSLTEPVDVPDYQTVLEQIVAEHPQKKLWGHIARLPAPSDEITRKMSAVIKKELQERETPPAGRARELWREDMLLVKGIACQALGRPDDAAACFSRFLQLGRDCAFYEVSREEVEARLLACRGGAAAPRAPPAGEFLPETGWIGTFEGSLRIDRENKILYARAGAGTETAVPVAPASLLYFLHLTKCIITAGLPYQQEKMLHAILDLAENRRPDLYSYSTFTEDLFGGALPDDNVIVLHDALAEEPIAVLHESIECLVRQGKLTFAVSDNVLSARDEKGTVIGRVPIRSAAALRQAAKSKETPAFAQHYLIRALTRELFADRDRALTEKIKYLRDIAALGAPALAKDTSPLDGPVQAGGIRGRDDDAAGTALRTLEQVLERRGADPALLHALASIKDIMVAKPPLVRVTTVRALTGLFDGNARDPLVYEYAVGILKEIVAKQPQLATDDVIQVLNGILAGGYDAPYIIRDAAAIVQMLAAERPIGRSTVHELSRLLMKQDRHEPATIREILKAVRKSTEKHPECVWPEQVMSAMQILGSGKWPAEVNDEAVGILRVAAEHRPEMINLTHVTIAQNAVMRGLFTREGIRAAAQFFRYTTENNPALIEPVGRAMMKFLEVKNADVAAFTAIRNIDTLAGRYPMLVDEEMVRRLSKILGVKRFGPDIQLSCIEALQKISGQNPAVIDGAAFTAAACALDEGSEWPAVEAALEDLMRDIVRNCPHVAAEIAGGQRRVLLVYRWLEAGFPFIRGYFGGFIGAVDPEVYIADLLRMDIVELYRQIKGFYENAYYGPAIYLGGPFNETMLRELEAFYLDLGAACPPHILFMLPPRNLHAVVAVHTGDHKTGRISADDGWAGVLRGLPSFDLPVSGEVRLTPNGMLILELSGPELQSYTDTVREQLRKTPPFSEWYQLDRVMIPLGRLISEKYTPAQLLRIRKVIDTFNEYGPFSPYNTQNLGISRLTLGRLNARGEAADTQNIYLTGPAAVFKPLLKKGFEKNLYGTPIGGGLIFKAAAPAAAIAGELKWRKIPAAKGIGRTIEIIQRYFRIIRASDRAKNEKYTTDISEFRIEFRTNVSHYACFIRETDPATGKDILKIVIDVDLLNTKRPADLLPFLVFLLGHEGSHAIVEDEADAQRIDKERFAKFSIAHQQAVLRVLQSLRASSSYIYELKQINKASIVSRSLKPPAETRTAAALPGVETMPVTMPPVEKKMPQIDIIPESGKATDPAA